METLQTPTLIENLSKIIEKSRHGEEAFFTDAKKAASDILKFLAKEKLLLYDN